MYTENMITRKVLLSVWIWSYVQQIKLLKTCKANSDHAVKQRNADWWFSNFRNSYFDLKDQFRIGTHQSFDSNVIKDPTESNPSTPICIL